MPAWNGYLRATDLPRIDRLMSRLIRIGCLAQNSPSLNNLAASSELNLLNVSKCQPFGLWHKLELVVMVICVNCFVILRLISPCTGCAAPYGFNNKLKLTENTAMFRV